MSSSFNPPRYPWPGDGHISRNDLVNSMKETARTRTVDQSLEIVATSGGSGVMSAPQAATATNECAWFRLLSSAEVVFLSNQGVLDPPDTDNMIKCRICESTPEAKENFPSAWGIKVAIDDCGQITDVPDEYHLLRFPSLSFLCDLQETACLEPGDAACDDRPVWWACQDPVTGNWLSMADGCKGDTLDVVEFCGPRSPVVLCPSGDCPPAETTETCCIFDGVATRMGTNCDYTCGGNVEREDIWMVCHDVQTLTNDDCIWARKIARAFTLEYCPLGPSGPTVSSTRPVYQLPCCGCGCPRDKLTLEFHTTNGVCQLPEKIVMDLYRQPPDGSGDITYKAWFCHDYLIPVYLTKVNTSIPEPEIGYVRPDCLSGQAVTYYRDDGAAYGACPGGCHVEWPIPPDVAPTGGGDCDVLLLRPQPCEPPVPDNCMEEWQTCRFCYEVTIVCAGGEVNNLFMKLALPPGHVAYTGTPLANPNAEPVDLIAIGDSNGSTARAEGRCSGRRWFDMDTSFGVPDLSPYPWYSGTYGFPHLTNHVFGACCISYWCIGDGVTGNQCGCCPPEDCTASGHPAPGAGCAPTVLVRASWNCEVSNLA